MRYSARYIIPILIVLFVAACARATPSRSAEEVRIVTKEVEAITEKPSAPPTYTFTKERFTAQAEEPRRIIYEADLELVVEDPEQAGDQITDLAEGLGGYVAEATFYRYSDKMAGRMTLRVPQERFQEALDQLRALAVRVDREELRTDDVTAEYVDLQARLRNLEATEEELRALLTEVRKRTQKASDVLAVYRELTQVREEIERIKGRLQMLETLTAFATIRVELRPYELTQPTTPTRWDPRITLHQAWGTLLGLLRGLVDLMIYAVVVVLPVLIIVALPILAFLALVRFLIRRRRK